MSVQIADRPVDQTPQPPPDDAAANVTVEENTTLRALDNYPLAATLYRPEVANDTVAIINSATAVPRQFYHQFAWALAGSGFTVLTYDYRGIGGSKPKNLRGFDATMSDWVFNDMAGALRWANDQWLPRVVVVGHSFGGQTPGLLENGRSIDAMLTLSAQSGHWRVQGGSQRLPVWLHTHATLPVLSRLVGYMPWSWVSSAEDLPKGVAMQWSAWCRNRNYLLDDPMLPTERYQTFRAPIRAYSIDDDDWGTEASVDEMMSAYPNVERRHMTLPTEGVSRLGHFGYFRAGAAPLWQRDIDWLASAQ
ncbi:MAG: alpha/beta fold hydrolase [Pseudomonadota bacterium]